MNNISYKKSVKYTQSTKYTQNNNLPSEAKIIMWMFLFFPIGMYYLHKRLVGNESDLLNEGKGLRHTGRTYIIISIIYLIILLGDTTDMSGENIAFIIFIFSVFGYYGYSLLRKGKKRRARARRMQKYYEIIMNKKIYSIDEIASIMNRKYSDVLNEIQLMVDLGYLENAFIDNNGRCVVFPIVHSNMFVQYNVNNKSEPEEMVVVCSSCGGKNKVMKGKVTECEYCKTFLDSSALN